MYYLILSWSQCIDKLARSIETEEDCCPVCYESIRDYGSFDEILSHMKRCYCLHKIQRETTSDLPMIDKANIIKTVVEDVEEEIDNYIIQRLWDSYEE